MKTTVEALRWALSVIETERVHVSFNVDAQKKFSRAKEILALSEFVESDVAPDYSKDGGFDKRIDPYPHSMDGSSGTIVVDRKTSIVLYGFEELIDTTPAAYAMPEQK